MKLSPTATVRPSISQLLTGASPLGLVAGDKDALHVIREPGRYICTEDVRAERGRAAVRIEADDVVLDLAGHTLVGDGASVSGVEVSGARCNIVIRAGIVRGWGGHGVDVSKAVGSRVEDVMAADNSGMGVMPGTGCTLDSVLLERNGSRR